MKHLPGCQPEIRLQAIDDLLIRPRLDFHPHRRALAAPVKLRVHGIQDAARFFLFEVKVAVARHSKRQPQRALRIRGTAARRRRGPRRAEIRIRLCLPPKATAPSAAARAAPSPRRDMSARSRRFRLQQKRQTQRLVQYMRERMRRIDCHRREQWLDSFLCRNSR